MTHLINVLVFESQQAVVDLEETLIELEKNFPYNRGNTDAIYLRIQQIRQNGYTNGNGPPFGTQKVSLKDFEELLTESYPLSDEVLLELLDLNEEVSLTPPFVRDVFIQNVPFSFDVLNTIEEASLPNGIKNQIIDADDAKIDMPDFAFEEFLAAFPGYKSLYEKLKNEEIQKLQDGMDPAEPGFDSELESIISDDFLQLIFNENLEVYIEGRPVPEGFNYNGLYKLYDSCRAIVFQNKFSEAYQDLGKFDQNGNIGGLPLVVGEGNGLTINEINNYIPTNSIIFNPQNMNPNSNGNDPFYETQGQTYNINEGCPKSYFNYIDTDENYGFQFDNYTDQLYPNQNYHQYWLFGDGKGSFEEDPKHIYSSFGEYEVTLVTFTDDCACWHVSKKTIVIDAEYMALKNGCSTQLYEGIGNSFYVTTNGPDPIAYPNATVNLYTFKLFSASNPPNNPPWNSVQPQPLDVKTSTSDPTYDISNQPDGNYYIQASVSWSEGCGTVYHLENHKYHKTSGVDCCDKSKREKKDTYTWTLGNRNYRLKYKDYANSDHWFYSGARIKGWQKFYRQVGTNGNGIYLPKKAQQNKVNIGGESWALDINTGECRYKEFLNIIAESCLNCRKVSNIFNAASKLGWKENSVEISHFVVYNDNAKTFPLVKLGEKLPNCNE